MWITEPTTNGPDGRKTQKAKKYEFLLIYKSSQSLIESTAVLSNMFSVGHVIYDILCFFFNLLI